MISSYINAFVWFFGGGQAKNANDHTLFAYSQNRRTEKSGKFTEATCGQAESLRQMTWRCSVLSPCPTSLKRYPLSKVIRKNANRFVVLGILRNRRSKKDEEITEGKASFLNTKCLGAPRLRSDASSPPCRGAMKCESDL